MLKARGLEGYEKFVCIDNFPRTFSDGGTDDADKYLTVGKIYEGKIDKIQGLQVYVEISDMGGPPFGHRWWDLKRFVELTKARENKLNEIGI